ncbi:MAG: hypothetical protein B7C24_01345 [Bacteroidetes bacterium 4572_77]|nr:MAG: hypothetical protein B7C24_01345 [Bacteroidetes bacterium 4572_77]
MIKKYRKHILISLFLLISFLLIRIFKADFSIPFIDFSILFLLSIYIWGALKAKLVSLNKSLKLVFTLLFWLPFLLITIASFALLFYPLNLWPPFFRVYFIGSLFSYITALLLPLLFLFMADIIKWFQMLLASKKKRNTRADQLEGKPISRKKFLVNTGLSLGGVVFGTMGFGMLHGNYHFKIWRHQIAIPNLPKALRGLKIVHISDLHLGTWASKEPLERAIQYINNLRPDLVVFTGDLVNSKTEEAFPFQEILSKIKAPQGIYASLGNHDYGHYHKWKNQAEENENWNNLLMFYKNMKWELLRNENKFLNIKGEKIQIIGVENWSKNPRFPQIGDLNKAYNNQHNSALNLLLSHDPTHWDEIVESSNKPIHITFSGHTHGFQFGFESSLFRWSPAQYMYPHWAGIYHNSNKSKYLHVNRGIGAIGFPGRIGIRPDISLIEIV